jgi:predicted Zn finger-like uncharacterized protein
MFQSRDLCFDCLIDIVAYLWTTSVVRQATRLLGDRVSKMRLICPNCDATYEVPDDVIPNAGRDVQCSSCNLTWFQAPAKTAADAAIDDTLSVSMAETVLDDFHTMGTEDTTPSVRGQQADGGPRSTMTPEIENILRQEAEFDKKRRATPTSPLETQTELGLNDSAEQIKTRESQESSAVDRLSRLRGIEAEEVAVGTNAPKARSPVPRRELLPDIEEINSTLTINQAAAAQNKATQERANRKQFRTGFFGMLGVTAAAFSLYFYGPQAKEALPQIAGNIDGYVGFVDKTRVMLDERLNAFSLIANTWIEKATISVDGAPTRDTPALPIEPGAG